MRLTPEQISRMMHGDPSISTANICVHFVAADHSCAPMPEMEDAFVIRVAGHHTTPDGRNLDADPSAVHPNADLVYADLYLGQAQLTQIVAELLNAHTDSVACHAASGLPQDGASDVHNSGILDMARRVFMRPEPDESAEWRPYRQHEDGGAP